MKKQQTESVVCVYRDDELVAIVKADPKTRKKLVYLTKEADVDDIAELINVKEPIA